MKSIYPITKTTVSIEREISSTQRYHSIKKHTP